MPLIARGTALAELLPAYDVNEVHSIWVAADPAEARRAGGEATIGEMPGVALMLAIRRLPERLLRRPGWGAPADRTILELLLQRGYSILAEGPREVVIGGVGRPWRLTGHEPASVDSADDFSCFSQPGYVKIAANLRAVPEKGGTRLSTETRVLATDRAARRKFGWYWRLVMPGSALIRRLWLRAARRRRRTTRRGP